jgi:hypothetical protein
MRSTRLISCLAIVGTLVALAGAPASAADPTVSATPSTMLADGQSISVSASGFAPDTFMAVVQCPTSTITPGTCDLNTVAFVYTDSNGSYSDFPFTVSRILSDGTDCALNGGCYIGTQDANAIGPTASTLITFDPNIPPLPPLEVTVRWDKTPNVSDKGVVALRGIVLCKNRGANVEVDADLRQIFDRSIFESFGYTLLTCAADSANPFRITIRPQNGLFGPGPAVLRSALFAGNIFSFRRVALDLQPKPTVATTSTRRYAVPSLTWR